MSQRFTLDCLVDEMGKVLIQVMVPVPESAAIGGNQRDAIWTATFVQPQITLTEEDEAPSGWTPENEDPTEQIGKVIGRVINLNQQRGPDQLSILLHLGLHNLLEAARGALPKEG